MWNDLITLVTTDQSGDGWSKERDVARRQIFANKKSVGYSEFYQADQAGYTSLIKFVIRASEYDGQDVVEYQDTRYRILRTYETKNGEFIELTLSDLSERMGVP